MKNANLHWWSVLLAAVVLSFSLGGCGKKQAENPAAYKSISDYFPIKVGERVVQMQLAVLPWEMQHGLMGRRDLGTDQGMIFIYDAPTRMSFYMRNTPTPLDIGFFSADGQLREVCQMYPFDERTVNSRSTTIQFALEMNQGWFKANDVKAGAQLDLKALVAALKARGLDPQEFKLRSQ